MRQDLETMSERELLMELVSEKRRTETLRWIKYGVAVACALIIGIYLAKVLPPIIRTITSINDNLQYIRSTLNNLEPAVTSLQEKFSSFSIPEGLVEDLEDLLNSLSGFTSLFH